MKTFDESYINLIKDIMKNGVVDKNERTGIETKSVFTRILEAEDSYGYSGIPVSNLRRIFYKGAIIETLWLLGIHRKDKRYSNLPLTNTRYLEDNGVKYWRPWEDINGNLGPVYGEQLVNWYNHNTGEHINQIQNIIDTLRKNPTDRRLVASMWNPAELDKMALPPCHHSLWFYSEKIPGSNKRVLHTTWHQRSCDMPIGIPYNILQYAIVNKIVSLCINHVPGKVTGVLGNVHYYMNQEKEVEELVKRFNDKELFNNLTKPKLEYSRNIQEKIDLGKEINLDDFSLDGSDFVVKDYKPLPKINIEVAV